MENFNPDLQLQSYEIFQEGSGEIDRYIYQQGEGLGSFFGNLFKKAVPLLGKAIKAAGKVAAPHAAKAGKEIIEAGAKRGFEELSKGATKQIETVHRPHKRRKWQNL